MPFSRVSLRSRCVGRGWLWWSREVSGFCRIAHGVLEVWFRWQMRHRVMTDVKGNESNSRKLCTEECAKQTEVIEGRGGR